MRFSFVFLFVLITVVFFSSESEASEELEENFSITINPENDLQILSSIYDLSINEEASASVTFSY